MVNIYDTANQLANDLRETQQFLALKEAMDAVKADEGSLALFKELQELERTGQPKHHPAKHAFGRTSCLHPAQRRTKEYRPAFV